VAIQLIKRFAFPIYDGDKVHFKDVSKSLVKEVFKLKRLEYKLHGDQIKRKLKREWKKRYNVLRKQKKNEAFTFQELIAAKVI